MLFSPRFFKGKVVVVVLARKQCRVVITHNLQFGPLLHSIETILNELSNCANKKIKLNMTKIILLILRVSYFLLEGCNLSMHTTLSTVCLVGRLVIISSKRQGSCTFDAPIGALVSIHIKKFLEIHGKKVNKKNFEWAQR